MGFTQSYQVLQDSFLRFGSEASCSSDGSSTNQKEAENELQNYLYNVVDEDQKIIFNSGATIGGAGEDQKPYGENPLDYSLEEIKQLISNNLCNNNLFVDENKTDEKVEYYNWSWLLQVQPEDFELLDSIRGRQGFVY